MLIYVTIKQILMVTNRLILIYVPNTNSERREIYMLKVICSYMEPTQMVEVTFSVLHETIRFKFV